MTGAPRCEAGVRTDELLALIAQYAVNEGPTRSGWPGLTFYRFGQRVAPHWDEVGSPSLYLVAKARQRIRMGSVNYFDDPFHVLVMTRELRFQAEVLQASPECPFLSFVLEVPSELVTEVSEAMKRAALPPFCIESVPPMPDVYYGDA